MKQILVLRKDLNMRKGKMIAQGAHASVKAIIENIQHPHVRKWFEGTSTKIAVSVESEEQLLAVLKKAQIKGLINTIVTDLGKTEFKGKPTNTCIAIGPATDVELQGITTELELL